ncbi:ribonuclease R [Buchnera aphidicola (Aphis helianthi)]|uniref:Ribonuclease R n=1 Tax=Buchnera aphidicola (Aphis helianthi) TaxID=2315802 RepID=A0A4D6XPH3_9GAMM|nr:ribonuclease R [Buchnera aphidicola]QCI17359.1 ribonuclease R [Buchnera aphidicola (Aphis helianthi)]
MVVDTYQKNDYKKYINRIPSRESILSFLKEHKNLINQKKIENKFSINNQEDKKALHFRLKAMERDNQIIYTCNRYYIISENLNIVTGKVIGHRDGYGFLRTETLKEDLWLSIKQMKLCIHGDIILARVIKSEKKGRNSAKVLKVLKPNNVLIVGRYYVEKKIKFVIPDDNRFNFKIFVFSSTLTKKLAIGSIVVVKLNKNFLKKKNKIKGIIVEILGGKEMRTTLAIDIAIRTHSIPYLWPKEVKNQIYEINDKIDQKELKNRIDLRHIPFFTIDEKDACDFDDAIFCKKKNNEEGWDLWVAISDVSYYIKSDSPLDKEAIKRGNSVYFPSLVVPMLPEKISIDLCSLNPYVERLCVICEMSLSNQGELIKYKHYEAVICSKGRFTYDEIFKIWNGDIKLCTKYNKLLKYIKNLLLLQKVFKKYNISKKGIYFENLETKFILDSNFKIKHIYKHIRNDAHKFIESCMILANIASARFIKKYQYPILFRNHDRPTEDSVKNFRMTLKELGLSLSGGEVPESVNYSNLLKKIKNRPDYEMIQTILLRSMKQAVYSPENRGHFGLSLSSYVHFTSPIRRYPDLLLHRVIKNILFELNNYKKDFKKNKSFKCNLYHINDIKNIGIHCSMTERRADEANRDVMDWLKCDFMEKKIGNIFTGVVSNVVSFGFFVRLNKYFIDGLVRIDSLHDDYYYFDPVRLKFIGKSTKNIFRLGDTLKVKVVSVNLHQRKIELSLYP